MSHFYQKPFVILPLLSLLAFSPKELDQHFSGRSIASIEAKKVLTIDQLKIDSLELRKLILIEEKKTDRDNTTSLIIIQGLNKKLNQLEKDLKRFATNPSENSSKPEDIKLLISEVSESKKLLQPLLAKAEMKSHVEVNKDEKDHTEPKNKDEKDHKDEKKDEVVVNDKKEDKKEDKNEDKKEDKKPVEEKHACDEKTSPVMSSQLELLIAQQNNLMMMMMNNMTQMMIQNNNRLWQTPSVPNDILYRYAQGVNQQPNYVYTQNQAPQSISEQQMGPQNNNSGSWNLAPQAQFNFDPRYTAMNVNPGQFGIGQFGYNFSQQNQPQVAINNQLVPQQMQMPLQAPQAQSFAPNFSNNYQAHLLQ